MNSKYCYAVTPGYGYYSDQYELVAVNPDGSPLKKGEFISMLGPEEALAWHPQLAGAAKRTTVLKEEGFFLWAARRHMVASIESAIKCALEFTEPVSSLTAACALEAAADKEQRPYVKEALLVLAARNRRKVMSIAA